jgi:shikimate dehydrogenase
LASATPSSVTPKILLGLIGSGIQASRTPGMHERECAAQGLHCFYQLIDLELLGASAADLPALLSSAQQMGFTGLNITHPCKQAVIPLLDELSGDATALGAVNTVVFRDGRLHGSNTGHNTDWYGFAESFRRGLPDVAPDHVVQLGAGGGGSATAYAAMKLGTKHLTLFDPDHSRAARVVEMLETQFGAGCATVGRDLESAMAAADGLIHATPTGMAKYPGLPLPENLLSPATWVAEIVYFPLETELLRVARSKGCRTLDGSGMAVFQAVEAFRLFTGREPDIDRMFRWFRELGPS